MRPPATAAAPPPPYEAVLPPPPPAPPPEAAAPSPIHYHGYFLLTKLNAEPAEYGVYTYVLSGNAATSGQPVIGDMETRYTALLRAIAAQAPSAVTLSAEVIPTRETNLFCIPAKAGTSNVTLNFQNYSSELAVRYRLSVERQLTSQALRNKLEDNTGPFLVSSLTRLSQTGAGAPILFADLSTTHPDAMQEVVKAYKQRVQSPLDKAEVFKPFKLALLSIILNGNDYVQIEKAAVASMLPSEGSH